MAALAPAALAVAAVGSVVKGVSEREAGYAQARAEEENARLAILSGEQDAFALLREERFQVGADLAAQGGSGLLSGGSIATLIEQSAFERELEIANIRMRSFREAENSQTRAQQARKAGDNAFVGGLFNAVSGALDGAATIRHQRRVEAQNARTRSSQRGAGAGGSTNFTRHSGSHPGY